MPDATAASPRTYQCRHLFTDGHRCGSKALRHEQFCFYHHKTRKPIPRVAPATPAEATFELPFPEDRAAIQLGIGEILQRIARNEIDPRRAGLLLYGFQIASLNLPKPTRDDDPEEPELSEQIVTDPTHGALAPIAEYAPYVPPLSLAGELLRELAGDAPSPETVLPILQAAAPHAAGTCKSLPRQGKIQQNANADPNRPCPLQERALSRLHPGRKPACHARRARSGSLPARSAL